MREEGTSTRHASSSPAVGALLAAIRDHRVIDRLRAGYAVLVLLQIGCVILYYSGLLPQKAALVVSLVTSFPGPAFSLAVSLHIFSHRRASRVRDIVSIALTYLVTCTSFAIIYVITSDRNPLAFTLPGGSGPPLTFGAALYFSTITITTTGYGDIAPLSGLARFVSCLEVMTGLAYQVFIFSLAASLLSAVPASATRVDP